MSNIEVSRLKPDLRVLTLVAALYAQVFAASPWNEVSRCGSTDEFSSEPIGSSCPCGCRRKEAYPIEETTDYIAGEITRTGAIAFLGTVNNLPVAFSWGFETSKNELAKSKWNTPDMQARVLSATKQLPSRIFYFSETGVKDDYRGKRYATQLVKQTVAQTKLPWVVRTLDSSPMARIATNIGLQKILSGEQDTERPQGDRILLAGYTSY